jgi:hypothetical protein
MEILPKQPTATGPSTWFRGDVFFDVIASGDNTRGR